MRHILHLCGLRQSTSAGNPRLLMGILVGKTMVWKLHGSEYLWSQVYKDWVLVLGARVLATSTRESNVFYFLLIWVIPRMQNYPREEEKGQFSSSSIRVITVLTNSYNSNKKYWFKFRENRMEVPAPFTTNPREEEKKVLYLWLLWSGPRPSERAHKCDFIFIYDTSLQVC